MTCKRNDCLLEYRGVIGDVAKQFRVGTYEDRFQQGCLAVLERLDRIMDRPNLKDCVAATVRNRLRQTYFTDRLIKLPPQALTDRGGARGRPKALEAALAAVAMNRRSPRKAEEVRDSAAEASDQAILNELLELVSKLPDRWRAVLRERYWNDSSLQETGTALGIGRQTVFRDERRALAKLRSFYGD